MSSAALDGQRRGDIYVEPWPGGGYVVRMAGVSAPISRHDTEEDAHDRAGRYQRGLDAARRPDPRIPADDRHTRQD